MATQTFFQQASHQVAHNDPSYDRATKENTIPAVINSANNNPEKQIYQNFAEKIAVERPELAQPTCFVFYAQDEQSENLAQRLSSNLEDAGVEVFLRANCKRDKREAAEYVHELALSDCSNVIVISHSDFLRQCEQYANSEKGRQKNNILDPLQQKLFRYVVKVSKQDVNVFEIQQNDCGNKLAQLLKTQPDECFFLYQFPYQLTALQVIRAIYGLPQQGRLYRDLKEDLNNVNAQSFSKRPQPEQANSVEPFRQSFANRMGG